MTEEASRRRQLEDIARAALDAVDAGRAVARSLDSGPPLSVAGSAVSPDAPVRLIALGKAAAGMADAALEVVGDRVVAGLVVTKDGHAVGHAGLPVREAGHPVPDARSEQAARALLALVAEGSAEELLLVLLSGGASALTTCPALGLTQEDLATTTSALLAGGADIVEMNAVRKHLSAFSGGRLAAAAVAGRIEVLAVSDVPGDALDVIGSGPCAPDPTRYEDALDVVARRTGTGAVPQAVRFHLERGARGEIAETVKPGDSTLARVRHTVVCSNAIAVEAAAMRARELGYRPIVLAGALHGEARVAGRRLASIARSTRAGSRACFIAGGETTVRLVGGGRGGRNQELALSAAIAFHERAASPDGLALLALGTDGTDGPTDAAGAYADTRTVERGRDAGVNAAALLAENDSYTFFAAEGGLLVTGPTGTNVMDLALVLA